MGSHQETYTYNRYRNCLRVALFTAALCLLKTASDTRLENIYVYTTSICTKPPVVIVTSVINGIYYLQACRWQLLRIFCMMLSSFHKASRVHASSCVSRVALVLCSVVRVDHNTSSALSLNHGI